MKRTRTTTTRTPRRTEPRPASRRRGSVSLSRVQDELPDVRDGLTRTERVILVELGKLSAERGGRYVSTFELWGRVVEVLDLSEDELQHVLARLAGKAAQFDAPLPLAPPGKDEEP